MNYELPHLPLRSVKPRNTGITMVMDKGLSIKEAEMFMEVSGDYVDYVKLGFGTSLLVNNLKDKVELYKRHNIGVYFGGTLFEIFLVRGMLDDYKRYLDKYNIELVEISDGSIKIPHEKKCEYIRDFSRDRIVISEVGYKRADIEINEEDWIIMMKKELASGSFKVIAEARESGNTGIYDNCGRLKEGLINSIISNIPIDSVIWEAPLKSQQVCFIKHYGCNVNLGNIPYNEVIPLETLRLGLRGDTFFSFISEELKNKYL